MAAQAVCSHLSEPRACLTDRELGLVHFHMKLFTINFYDTQKKKVGQGACCYLPLRHGGKVHNAVLKTAVGRLINKDTILEVTQVTSSYSYSQAWWCTLFGPALRRQKQADLCEFKSSLVYMEHSRPARST